MASADAAQVYEQKQEWARVSQPQRWISSKTLCFAAQPPNKDHRATALLVVSA